MNIKWNRPAALLACLILLFSMSIVVCAHDVPDMDRLCSLTFTMHSGDIGVGGGSLTLYRVGEVTQNDGNYSFKPTGEFAECGESLDDLEEEGLSDRLKAFADGRAIVGMVEKEIDATGKVVFEKLPVGLYLVVQHRAAPGYKAIAPFLVSLPYFEGDRYQYDLSAKPKMELEPEKLPPPTPTPAPTPTPVPPSHIPQTGQLWRPVPVLICSGLFLMAVGFFLKRRSEPDER